MIRCSQVERQLERAFVEQRHDEIGPLRAHLSGCASCRAFYDDLFSVEAALGGIDEPGALSATELQLLSAQVVPAGPEAGAAGPRRAIRWQLAGALALALLLIGTALWVRLQPPGSRPGLQSRGQDGAMDAALAPVGLRLLCLESADGGEVRARSLGDRPLPGTRPCRRADSIALTARNETDRRWYLRVLLEGERTGARGSSSTYPTGGSLSVEPVGDERSIGEPIALGRFPTGMLRITALFTTEKLDADELQRLVAQADSTRNDVHVVRLSIEVAP